MNALQALLLGLVEGLTEFVPVSSTGHLILAKRALGLQGEGIDAFLVVIQLGALLAAILYYRRILWDTAVGFVRGDAAARRLTLALVLGALPALALGYLFGKKIKAALFGPGPVAKALIIGGVVMVLVEAWQRRRIPKAEALADITPRQALLVGVAQAAALLPGTSRSMASIVGGMLAGLTTPLAADFAFLLAVPTLGAATLYDLLKSWRVILADTGALSLAIGMVVSFVSGWLVIAAFLRYLRRVGLSAFGYYRVAIGAVVLFLT